LQYCVFSQSIYEQAFAQHAFPISLDLEISLLYQCGIDFFYFFPCFLYSSERRAQVYKCVLAEEVMGPPHPFSQADLLPN
jgi:hypothetical protein